MILALKIAIAWAVLIALAVMFFRGARINDGD